MPPPTTALPAHVRTLLDCLRDPAHAASLDEHGWDILIRAARAARLLGVVSARVSALGVAEQVPAPVRRHLDAARIEARFRRQKVLFALDTVLRQIGPLDAPLVLLKGAAYIAQQLPIAEGRMPADVDLMGPRALLAQTEARLAAAGWEFEKTDSYDQHYYRAWSHELPPMRCAGQALELDLHHAILPPLGRLRPQTDALFADSVAVEGSPFRVLAPADQVLHAAAHVFQDSDCVGRIRDLVDLDGLIRHFASCDTNFWVVLLAHAHRHGLGRPLWYALIFCRDWLQTPIDADFKRALDDEFGPNRVAASLVIGGAGLVLPPPDPDGEPTWREHLAGALLLLRSVWLRLPPGILVYHALRKAARGLAARFGQQRAQPV